MQNGIPLLRAILISLRERQDCQERVIEIPGHNPQLVVRHAEGLYADGFIEGLRIRTPKGLEVISATALSPKGAGQPHPARAGADHRRSGESDYSPQTGT